MKKSPILSRLAIVCLVVLAACSKDEDPGEDTSPPAVPVAAAASNISANGFTATWAAATGATGYQLDLSADNFATFVTGYSSKSVTATTEAVTGLTPHTTYKYRVRSINTSGASLNSNEITVSTLEDEEEEEENVVVAAIDDEDFVADEITVTDTNVGLELNVTSGDNEITVRIPDKVAGTYTIQNNAPLPGGNSAVATWLKDDAMFFAESGSITVTLTEGQASFEFTADGKSETGTPSKITKGKVEKQPIKQPATSGCLLGTNTGVQFAYDKNGRLTQIVGDGSVSNFFWKKDRITKATFFRTGAAEEQSWIYTGDKLTQVTGKYIGTDDTYTIDYTYTGDKLTKAEVTRGEDFYTNTVSYDGDNVASVTTTENDNLPSEHMYTSFDAKNSYAALLVQATGNPQTGGLFDVIDGRSLSKNNVRVIDGGWYTQTYTYNSYSTAGYPTSITFTMHLEEDENNEAQDITSTTTLSYIGCNN